MDECRQNLKQCCSMFVVCIPFCRHYRNRIQGQACGTVMGCISIWLISTIRMCDPCAAAGPRMTGATGRRAPSGAMGMERGSWHGERLITGIWTRWLIRKPDGRRGGGASAGFPRTRRGLHPEPDRGRRGAKPRHDGGRAAAGGLWPGGGPGGVRPAAGGGPGVGRPRPGRGEAGAPGAYNSPHLYRRSYSRLRSPSASVAAAPCRGRRAPVWPSLAAPASANQNGGDRPACPAI